MESFKPRSDVELKKLPNAEENLKRQEPKRVYYDRITILSEANNQPENQIVLKRSHKPNHTLDSEPSLACQQCALI